MVCLSVAILTKAGKVLVSRQFVEISRIRIEGLLAAFPKLLGSGKQHTFVETESVRYVYQPLEGLYFLMVTNKQSNIIEDLETLRLLAKLMPEYCSTVDEETVLKNAFELIFAFDEVISLGYRENVNIQHIRTYTEMESHEEKLAMMIKQSKINEAKEESKRREDMITKQKADQKKSGVADSIKSFSSGGMDSMSSSSMGGGFDGGSPTIPEPERPRTVAAPKPRGKGMTLKPKAAANVDLLAAMASEGEIMDMPRGGGPAAAVQSGAPQESVSIKIEEKISVILDRDGGVQQFEVKGDMELLVNDSNCARIVIPVTFPPEFQAKTHPNINKQLFNEQSILGLKDPAKPFPTGNPLGILKWRFSTSDENAVPFKVECWPNMNGDGSCDVSIEYTLNSPLVLQNVLISIPFPAGTDAPAITDADGEATYVRHNNAIEWALPLIDKSNSSGSMEFTAHGVNADQFFPVEINFTSVDTFCALQIHGMQTTDTNEQVRFDKTSSLCSEQYQVV